MLALRACLFIASLLFTAYVLPWFSKLHLVHRPHNATLRPRLQAEFSVPAPASRPNL
jgi:hypothetical protein